jgi:SAM-dependent methyltransferase
MDTDKKNVRAIQHHVLEFAADEEARQIEDSLWWLLGRKTIIRKFLHRAGLNQGNIKVMDVGCGSGGVFDVLTEFGELYGVEPSAILARRARARGLARDVFEGDIAKLEITRHVDVITMFDVLEHIEDDVEFLKRIRNLVPEDHLILMSVPACQFLYGEHDSLLHHYRRYSRQTLSRCFSESGYEVINMSYFMFILFPLVLLERCTDQIMKFLGRKRTKVNIGDNVNPFIGKFLTQTLALEAILSNIMSFPIGLWLFALIRPSSSHAKGELS